VHNLWCELNVNCLAMKHPHSAVPNNAFLLIRYSTNFRLQLFSLLYQVRLPETSATPDGPAVFTRYSTSLQNFILEHVQKKMSILALLGRYKALIGGWLSMFPDRVWLPSYFCTLKMGATGCSETSVTIDAV
jgi:hypothetical protein